MASIGQLQATRDGGWAGSFFILAHEVKVKLAPNDNQENPRSPAFRLYAGTAELGALWLHKTNGGDPQDYLSGEADFPGLPEPISFAVFFAGDGKTARVKWTRRKDEENREGDHDA